MKGLMAKVAINEAVTPVGQAVRRIPVHFLPIVIAKLDQMETVGMITPVIEYAVLQITHCCS